MSALNPTTEPDQTDDSCLDITVEVSAKELGRILSNYESERFRATCGWKNYNDLKSAVEKAGYSAYSPVNLKDEVESLRKKIADLEGELESRDKREGDRCRFSVSRLDYDVITKRCETAEAKVEETRNAMLKIYNVVMAHYENFGGPSASDALKRIKDMLANYVESKKNHNCNA